MTIATAAGLRTTTSATGHVAVVAPDASLGADHCAPLREALRAAASGGAGLVILDLLDVPTMDDCVVELLVDETVRCGASGVRVVIANAAAQPWLALTRAHVAGVVRAHRRAQPPLAELLELLTP